MELFQCVSDHPQQDATSRARSEERLREANSLKAVKQRRQSLPAPPPPPRLRRSDSSGSSVPTSSSGWSKHYETKKSTATLDRLTSRTLSPPPDTLPRKYSRSQSVLANHSVCARLARHPELPPLTTEADAPRLADYLEKPRLVSTAGRRPSKVMPDVEELIPGLTKLTSYYNQTFLNVCDTCDSLNHKNPVSVLNASQSTRVNRGM